MSVHKMGFEGMIYANAASGGAATVQVINSRDISITTDPEYGSTKTRGNGSAPPIKTQHVTGLTFSCDFTMIEKSDDTTLELLKAAAAAGTAVAFRMKDHSAGKGFDGDVLLSHKQSKPLAGEQTHDFTVVPSLNAATPRTPQLYV